MDYFTICRETLEYNIILPCTSSQLDHHIACLPVHIPGLDIKLCTFLGLKELFMKFFEILQLT